MPDVLSVIRDRITAAGPLPVDAYMDIALQHPTLGYYRQHDPLGREGDFITAPEISQLFGEMIGLWCADAWRRLGKPEKFMLLELGPGRGTLMQDALRATAKISGFHQAMDLCLLESNATLRAMQTEKLGSYHPRHLDGLDGLPACPALIIANEFFDALPVRQFEKTLAGWCERLVAVENDRLVFVLSAHDPAFLLLIPDAMHEAAVGSVYELSLASLRIMRDLAEHISAHSGAALVIDYGYAEAGGAPTLQAISKHAFADVLDRPGEIDLTAHVDFGALKRVAGEHIRGPIVQGAFLKALGIELRAMQLKQHATPEQAHTIDVAVERLTDAAQMGNLFKVMAFASPQLSDPAGF